MRIEIDVGESASDGAFLLFVGMFCMNEYQFWAGKMGLSEEIKRRGKHPCVGAFLIWRRKRNEPLANHRETNRSGI